jgi:hypothetical protein
VSVAMPLPLVPCDARLTPSCRSYKQSWAADDFVVTLEFELVDTATATTHTPGAAPSQSKSMLAVPQCWDIPPLSSPRRSGGCICGSRPMDL